MASCANNSCVLWKECHLIMMKMRKESALVLRKQVSKKLIIFLQAVREIIRFAMTSEKRKWLRLSNAEGWRVSDLWESKAKSTRANCSALSWDKKLMTTESAQRPCDFCLLLLRLFLLLQEIKKIWQTASVKCLEVQGDKLNPLKGRDVNTLPSRSNLHF